KSNDSSTDYGGEFIAYCNRFLSSSSKWSPNAASSSLSITTNTEPIQPPRLMESCKYDAITPPLSSHSPTCKLACFDTRSTEATPKLQVLRSSLPSNSSYLGHLPSNTWILLADLIIYHINSAHLARIPALLADLARSTTSSLSMLSSSSSDSYAQEFLGLITKVS
ncbi:unnamed protein product, partial [Protopolystoma xenopodis]